MDRKILLIMLSIFFISLASAQVSYCCEKTLVNDQGTGGMWCQNIEDEAVCDPDYYISQTSCEATSYCKQGCCYNSQEGTCLKNSAERVCTSKGGVWDADAECAIPQCDLGCCLIGNQAAFVTQTRCKRLSNYYGLPISFRNDITSELQCILSAKSEALGACVFEKEFERTCLMISQEECYKMEGQGTKVEFYEGLLCSNDQLNTICGPSKQTSCVEGKDEVYYLDSCGNVANIYDSDKQLDSDYWAEIKPDSDICGIGVSNADSAICGNCDYYGGSTCKKTKMGDTTPVYGEYFCENLNCEENSGIFAEKFNENYERYPKHGETWCYEEGGVSQIEYEGEDVEVKGTDSSKENLPGSRYYRLMCYNGEVIEEPCADYRQEICVESTLDFEGRPDINNFFKTASCRVNRWQDCVSQKEIKDCENTDKRDCEWYGGVGPCLPRYSPGFDFWESEEDAETMCNVGSNVCVVEYEKKIIGTDGDWKCKKNCECEEDLWAQNANKLCRALGDCGASVNYIGKLGDTTYAELTSISGRLKEDKLEESLSTVK